MRFIFLSLLGGLAMPLNTAFASNNSNNHAEIFAVTFLWLAVILLAAKFSTLIERFGQPAVLGELIIGVILGNLVLLGFSGFEPIKNNKFIAFLAELGVVVLLFQIGLESNISKMKRVGIRALLVAVVGVIVPFILGTYLVGPWLLPNLEFNAYLFLGATLTATSVGITARVFQDLKKLHTKEAQIVLGAAVIDDVLGLIILAVVSAIATTGGADIATIIVISVKALLFLIGAIFIGQLVAPILGRYLSRIHSGSGMKLTMAMIFCLVLAYVSQKIGLAPIVGAFASGLVLDPVHFKNFEKPNVVSELECIDHCRRGKISEILEKHSNQHVEDLVRPLGFFLVPIFFVTTGLNVNLETLFNLPVLLLSLGIAVAAFVGKIVAGVVAGKVDRLVVGFGMIPRGEVGLIFAMMGKALGVISDQTFSVIVIVVILSTLLTPPILTYLLRRQKPELVTA